MRSRVTAWGIVALSVCVFGCGGGGDYSSPKATYQTMLNAAKAGDGEGVENCYDEASRKTMAEMANALKDLRKVAGKELDAPDKVAAMAERLRSSKIEIGDQTITGDKATLDVTHDGVKVTHKFINERGAWKMQVFGEATPDEMKKSLEAMREAAKKLQELKAKSP